MTDSSRTPSLTVFIGDAKGRVFTRIREDRVRDVLGVSIQFKEKKGDSGTLSLRDPDSYFLDSKTFFQGQRLKFVMGWTDELQTRGPYIVKGYAPAYPEDGQQMLEVKFQDHSHRLNKKQRRKRYDNIKPAQLVKKIAKSYGLGYDIESITGVKYTDDFPLIQANITDAALLQRLAERYGFVWGVEGDTLYFRAPRDNESSGRQGEIVTLSYRINDLSMKSFSPSIKYTKEGKRKTATNKQSNLDLQAGVEFTLESTRKTVNEGIESLKGLLGLSEGEKTGDQEPENPGEEVSNTLWNIEEGISAVTEIFQTFTSDEENVESEPSDVSGSATPASENEAKARSAGKIVPASEIIEGTVVPRIASMRWRSGSAIILAGLGEVMSGRYRVVGVSQTIAPGGVFVTSLEVRKRTFLPSTAAKEKIAEAGQAEGDSSTSQPPETNALEETVNVNITGGTITVVDGKVEN